MSRVRAFALFWWDFIVGDDYRIAVGVVALLGLVAALSHVGRGWWWVAPVGVLALLSTSVLQAGRRAGRPDGSTH